ncbi:Bifunctional DNA primase/polymerase, N-terminal [Streptomyces sp. Termitarium-T10T-6]|nr:Bifunctional DNA primase/polymerase, N-terminal [Streptomyces sp. Termitarium-T10T-6]
MAAPHNPALLGAALASAERDWPVFPLRPGDKRPAGHPERTCPGTGRCADGHRTPEQRATLDADSIRACWESAPYNVGIATGPAGLVVVDLDLPKDADDTAPSEWAGMADGLDVFAALCERAGVRDADRDVHRAHPPWRTAPVLHRPRGKRRYAARAAPWGGRSTPALGAGTWSAPEA